jgi:rhamnose utilization protein RhaD (predicted bifunctional aldolase and dehydrogenase)
MPRDDILSQLVTMSRSLGEPGNDYVILGEGNSSARAGQESFWVKASGTELATIGPEGFVEVSFERVQQMLDGPDLSDEETRQALQGAKVDPDAGGHPSVETVLHALCLELPGVNFVGHTHPTAINSITCSREFAEAVDGRLFPDEIVICGPATVVVPYTDPGLPLAREVQRRIDGYLDAYGEVPKTILLQNHGFIALGSSPRQVLSITAMAAKAARILLGAYALGGPRFMTPQAVARIHTRPDEHYRQRALGHK